MSGEKLLAGKTAIVTGGSRGIGQAVVERFIENGAVVYALSRSGAGEAQARHIACDVSDESAVVATIKTILSEVEGIDIVVNNAGITRDGLTMRMKSEDWDAVMDVNLKSAFLVSREVMRHMIKRRSGSIINISSVVGIMGNAGQANYSASKAGLIGLTKSLAKEIGSRNVRVNAVAPGFIETDMTSALNDDQREVLVEQIPIRRIGTGREVADVCTFLASEMASYVTGEVIAVSGGLTF